jgi:hypothetical protein
VFRTDTCQRAVPTRRLPPRSFFLLAAVLAATFASDLNSEKTELMLPASRRIWRAQAWPPLNTHRAERHLAFLLLLVFLLGPVFAVEIPAMVDYPNHLARMYVLSRAGTAAASSFYQVTWGLYPNLAMDLIVPPLARFTSVDAATKAFYLVSQLLVISGTMMLERVVKGRLEIAPIAVAMFLYCFPFAYGFVNFEFGFGVALWAIAAWWVMERRPWYGRAVVHCILVMILFVAHFFALGIYGAAIGLHELWRIKSGRTSPRDAAITLTMLVAPVVALLGAMTLFGGSIGGARNVWGFALKPGWLFAAMSGYSLYLSTASMAFLLSASFVLARLGLLKLVGSGTWIAAGFAIIYLAMPSHLFDTAFADVRMVAAAAFILPAFIRLSVPNATWRRVLFAVVTVFTLANVVLVWSIWISYRPEYSAMIASFGRIAKGSTVLVASSENSLTPITHAPTLAVPYVDAFVPTLFTYPGKQPVSVRLAYRHLADARQLAPPQIALLQAIASGTFENPPDYLRSWPSNFDYLYVVGARPPANPLPSLLREVTAGSRFVLYKIENAAASGAARPSDR